MSEVFKTILKPGFTWDDKTVHDPMSVIRLDIATDLLVMLKGVTFRVVDVHIPSVDNVTAKFRREMNGDFTHHLESEIYLQIERING